MILHAKHGPVELSTDTVDALQARYPTKNVAHEIQLAHLWLLEHERKRPVRIYAFLRNWLVRSPDVRRPAPVLSAWWTTEAGTLKQGEALGLRSRPGEDMQTYRQRISAALEARAA